ncbi:MAG: hypothetical protein J0I06_22105 [Planctomycetes bacterium]|nr:hypothetical protein [Planctomycetota bacterium]
MPSDEKPEPEPAPAEEPKKPARTKPRGRKAGKKAYPVLTKNRMFAGLVCGVLVFALLAFLTLISLAFFGKDPPTQLQSRLADVCYFVITATIGALVGLVGGRAAAPDTWQSGEPKT